MIWRWMGMGMRIVIRPLLLCVWGGYTSHILMDISLSVIVQEHFCHFPFLFLCVVFVHLSKILYFTVFSFLS